MRQRLRVLLVGSWFPEALGAGRIDHRYGNPKGRRLSGKESPPISRRPDPRTDRADEPLDLALDRARQGEEAGFVELWQTLHPPLLRYLTAGRNEAPEDIAAETWLQVIRGLGKFSGNASDFRAFLFTVARNRAIDAGRARAARPVTLVAEPPDARTTASAEVAVLENQGTQAALRMVSALPPAQAELVMLRVVAGLDVAQVASIVGKQPGTVRVGVHRALQALRRIAAEQSRMDDQREEVG